MRIILVRWARLRRRRGTLGSKTVGNLEVFQREKFEVFFERKQKNIQSFLWIKMFFFRSPAVAVVAEGSTGGTGPSCTEKKLGEIFILYFHKIVF